MILAAFPELRHSCLVLLRCTTCRLQLSDIPKTISKVPTATSSLSGGATLLTHELFTNDVLYAEAALDLTGLPAGLLPLLPLFCRSLTQVRTVAKWYEE
jgi:Zn-dependent M16 (insulinase) family peptidase